MRYYLPLLFFFSQLYHPHSMDIESLEKFIDKEVKSQLEKKIEKKNILFSEQIVKICVNGKKFDLKLTFEDKNKSSTGTGFIYNAKTGDICTNFHVISKEFSAESIVVELGDERFYDVQILGGSPSAVLGDFFFIRVPSLANRFQQMKINPSYKHIAGEKITTFGYGKGLLSTCEAEILAPYNFTSVNSYGDPYVHNITIGRASAGGSSGSPVFNNQEEIIALLYAGSDKEKLFYALPIYYVHYTYENFISQNKKTITFSLNCGFTTIKGTELIGRSAAKKETLEKTLNGKLFNDTYLVCSVKDGGSSIKTGDVLLSINEKPIGLDSFVIHQELQNNEKVRLGILRHQQELTIDINRTQHAEHSVRYMNIWGHSFYEAGWSRLNQSPLNYQAPLYFTPASGDEWARIYLIDKINGLKINTFKDFMLKFQSEVLEKKTTTFQLSMKNIFNLGGKFQNTEFTCYGLYPSVILHCFENDKWKKVFLKEYLRKDDLKK